MFLVAGAFSAYNTKLGRLVLIAFGVIIPIRHLVMKLLDKKDQVITIWGDEAVASCCHVSLKIGRDKRPEKKIKMKEPWYKKHAEYGALWQKTKKSNLLDSFKFIKYDLLFLYALHSMKVSLGNGCLGTTRGFELVVRLVPEALRVWVR